ncbi:MAG: 1-deoxy-D-xylulose-5-phosphate synthase [Candidatus Obscuribacterales bacterium]|nr:1-deoxy-D-xylulose-5-phosphate synthase [Candidatus Obscuribacterales bacterium]
MQTLVQHPTSFLDAIVAPAELKKLSINELRSLAEEIRSEIVRNLNKTGGHLASNLGIVEITLALHYVFDSPKDQILWDVGHQAYVHKMLTGRRDRFHTLRQFKGISGFIHPQESEHDAFIAGHSSTSVSLAVGMALARDHLEQDHKVIALIGDGGLTGGMALEALNHLGDIQRDVLILLNDNEMSISENVGGISQYMKRIKETYFYKDIKEKITMLEGQLDGMSLTPAVWKLIESVKQEATERIDTPGIVFEKLGINYSGPIDGHDVGAVIEVFQKVKAERVPLIAHLITQKGKGFDPAERDSIKYHGVKKAFSLEPRVEPAADKKPKAKTYSDIFTDTLIELAELEPNLVAITPATAEGSGLVKFGKVYPERFFDVAICEQHGVTMAAGMAKAGLKPVVSIYSTFLQRAMDQVIHDVAIMNLPVVFGIDRGGLVEDGETHQGVFDIAYLRSVPNFTVLAPKDAVELRNMLYTVVKELHGPVAIRFPREEAVNAATEQVGFAKVDFSSWEVEHKGDDEVVILAYGAMVKSSLDALDAMKAGGVNATIINARSVKPLDEATLTRYLNQPNTKIITLEEGCSSGGFGAAVLEFRSRAVYSKPQVRLAEVVGLGVPDRFIEHGNRSILMDEVGLSPAKIASFVIDFVRVRG